MALTANRELDHFVDQTLRTYAVENAAHVYKGALVGLSAAGYAQPLTAGDPFVGVAYAECDNTGGADGAESVRVYTVGDFEHALSGATITSVGRPVFASDDGALTFTSNGNSYVGLVQDVVESGTIILRIDPNHRHIKTIVHQIEDLSADGDIAARAIHCFGKEGWIVAARVVNQAGASAGIDDSNTCTVTLTIDAGTLVTEVFDSSTTFPGANAAKDLGALSNTHAALGNVLTLAVTNGTNADPDTFLVEVDYV